ncbi:MAG: cyclic nucleotide-binding domain-containing protein [Thermodesulfobacteriota bacterium]
MEITQGFTTRELQSLRRRLVWRSIPQGERIILRGDTNRDLFLLTKGTVTIKVSLPQSHRLKRLLTFGAGVIIGEMAFLDAKPRSADVWIEEDSEVLILSYQEFIALSQEEPAVALKLLVNIAKVLSLNVRRGSRELQALEES